MPALTVVALISGGKDSFFSILHCIANGHKVIALANLHPPRQSSGDVPEDLDSYMYQTVGHTIIPLYQDALGIPLYRQPIEGTAVNHTKAYQPPSDDKTPDETESLTTLLRQVISAHPDVNAVSTGAILSDYQRTRVESVALRLGLTPLSYLWQWPSLPSHSPSSLLEDMSAIGQDSRIIKVASGGLDDSFLWQNVAESRTIARLKRAAMMFGTGDDGAVIGEGGEYETLTVDGPAPLWQASIVAGRREVIVGDAGSSSVLVHSATLQYKEASDKATSILRAPSMLDAKSQRILELALISVDLFTEKTAQCTTELAVHSSGTGFIPHTDANRHAVVLSRLVGQGCNATQQTHSVMTLACERLSLLGHSMGDIAYTSIILRDMADFPDINAAYGEYFSAPNPPARVAIACAEVLPVGCHLMVGLTSVMLPDRQLRRALHVQSLSYWAPANIGPYSQAISVPYEFLGHDNPASLIFIAGQIALVPASMSLVEVPHQSAASDLAYEAVLALQHLERIGNAMQARRWVAVIAFVVVSESMTFTASADVVSKVWTASHNDQIPDNRAAEDEIDDFDVWNLNNGQGHMPWRSQPSSSHPHSLDLKVHDVPPIHVIQVDALPRGAHVEWAGYGSSADDDAGTDIPHMRHLMETFRDRVL